MNLAPILLFVYNRPDTLVSAVGALQQNPLARSSELFIFSDQAKSEKDKALVSEVRAYAKTIEGFSRVHLVEAAENKGLARSIITGVSQVIDQYGKVIVLEDDLVTSTNFLSFMNQALARYADHAKVFSIGGYSSPVRGLQEKEVYCTLRGTSWGWATWKEKWDQVDWEMKDYAQFSKDRAARRAFNRMGSDMAGLLDRQMSGKINSWAIRWCYHQFRHELYTVYPAVSKVANIGFSDTATHTKNQFNRFRTPLDQTNNNLFLFPDELVLDQKIIRQFRRPYSIPTRIKYKLLKALPG